MPTRPQLPWRLLLLSVIALLLMSCGSAPISSAGVVSGGPVDRAPTTPPTAWPAAPAEATAGPAEATAQPAEAAPTTYTYRVINRFPHDANAWTQGLIYMGDDRLYEGTGEYARSSLREVRLSTGEVVRAVGLCAPVECNLYGEGIAVVGDTVFQLTWQDCVGLLYNKDTFEQTGRFNYPQVGGQCAMQGWGLTYDGSALIMSDGTSTLSFVDPQATVQSGQLAIVRQMQVTDRGQPVTNLNELEYINGEVFANVWKTDWIARIDPATGVVRGWVDLSGLLSGPEDDVADVLNGIAYDAAGDRLFVTGKYWPALFEIKLDPKVSYLPLIARG